jgi:hypothetical protein
MIEPRQEPPKVIRLSNLAARYYIRDGWSLETINQYLLRGQFARMNFMTVDDPYFVLEQGASVDADRILRDFPDLEIVAHLQSERTKSRKELIESRNW